MWTVERVIDMILKRSEAGADHIIFLLVWMRHSPCGAMKINVQEMNVDFLTTSVYKWLQGIQGLGFAYIPLFYENSFSDGNGLGQC